MSNFEYPIHSYKKSYIYENAPPIKENFRTVIRRYLNQKFTNTHGVKS